MKARLVRLGLGASLLLVAAAPMTQSAHAWSCYGAAQPVCVVVGTGCRAVDGVTGLGRYCTFY